MIIHNFEDSLSWGKHKQATETEEKNDQQFTEEINLIIKLGENVQFHYKRGN